MTETKHDIPMPGLIAEAQAIASDRDPATSHEHGPIAGRAARDPSDVGLDDPVTVYARRLWTQLDLVAAYLRDEVARGGALGPEEQWQRWRVVYARALSALAGPAGDNGYGEQEARLEYQNGYRPAD